MLKIGSLVFATDSGLGVLAREFVRNGIVTHPCIVRHGRHQTHNDWYPLAMEITSIRDQAQIDMAKRFCEMMDCMLFFETPFIMDLLPHCREKGIRTVIMPMYECQLENPPYHPDAYLCPSLLDLQVFREKWPQVPAEFIPVPVDVPWRQRTRAEVFVFNSGHGGLRGRNGTHELLEAMRHVQSPIRLIVRSQSDRTWEIRHDNRIEYRLGTAPYADLWTEGDALVFPDKFDGLSLPLQEARASGMLVCSTNRFPANTWLPKEPLIKVSSYRRISVGGAFLEIDEAVVEPKAIAETIDRVYGMDIAAYSLAGREWAEQNSWQVLGPQYREFLERICHGDIRSVV